MTTAARTLSGEPGKQRRWMKAEEIALIVLFATLTFDNLHFAGIGQKGIGVTDITPVKLATLIALGMFVMRALINKDPRLFTIATTNLTSYLIYAFIAVSCLSVIVNTNLDPGKVVTTPGMMITRRVQYAILFYVIIAVSQRLQLIHYAIVAYFLGGLLTCYAGCYEMVTGEQFLSVTPWQKTELLKGLGMVVRSQGLHEDADHQATFLLVGMAFVPYLWHTAKRFYLKIAVVLITALYVVCAFATGAKGGWIGMALVFAFFVAFLPGRRKWAISAIVLLVAAGIFIGMGQMSTVVTYEKFSSHYAGSNTMRLGLIQMAWETVKDHPILGAGTASSPYIYHRYFPAVSSMVPNRHYPQLNAYMMVWAEQGTIGLVVLLTLCAVIFLEVSLAIRNAPDTKSKILGMTLIAAYLSMLWMLHIYVALDSKYFWITVGLGIAYSNLFNQPAEQAAGVIAARRTQTAAP